MFIHNTIKFTRKYFHCAMKLICRKSHICVVARTALRQSHYFILSYLPCYQTPYRSRHQARASWPTCWCRWMTSQVEIWVTGARSARYLLRALTLYHRVNIRTTQIDWLAPLSKMPHICHYDSIFFCWVCRSNVKQQRACPDFHYEKTFCCGFKVIYSV